MLLLAIGAALVSELFSPVIDRTKTALLTVGLIGVIVWLTFIYNKTNNGTSKNKTDNDLRRHLLLHCNRIDLLPSHIPGRSGEMASPRS